MTPRPLYSAAAAVARALERVGRGVYQLGTGDITSTGDDPRDCFGFAVCECYGIRRHRPGFNRGAWSSVEDDLNVNAAIEDADHHRDLFERIDVPQLGALIGYPTIRLRGHEDPWVGHVKIVVGVSRVKVWDPARPDWTQLDTVECSGPNGHRPGIVRGTGLEMTRHDIIWPRPEHRTAMLRVRP